MSLTVLICRWSEIKRSSRKSATSTSLMFFNLVSPNASTDEEKNNIILEYDMWKWTFPKSVSEKIDIEKRKKILKEKIELLQLELSKLS